MHRSVWFRPLAAALAIAMCSALSFPALADSAVTVTFQPNTHWVQEVDTLSQYDNSHDYSVAIKAGQTFQINLVTRDPNVFFKVKDTTRGKQLVDTFKTGATTWSVQTSEPTTYLVHVYVQPEAMQRDEKPKYALQLGQYGPEDLRPETTALTFEDNDPWAQESGTLDAQGSARDFTVAVPAGQTLDVKLIAQNPQVHFKVSDESGNQTLVDSATTNATTWSTPVATATNYTISVYANPSALPPGSRAGYVLQVGRYAQGNAQPGAPAAGGTAAPATATSSTATTPATASSAE